MRWDEKREREGEETGGEEGKAKKVTRQAYRKGDISQRQRTYGGKKENGKRKSKEEEKEWSEMTQERSRQREYWGLGSSFTSSKEGTLFHFSVFSSYEKTGSKLCF